MRVAFALGLAALAAIFSMSDVSQRWGLALYDKALAFWPEQSANDVVIVGVDEYSLDTLGRWPWSRRTHAKLIDRLSAAGAKVIGMDIAFSESDTQDPSGDELLAEAMARSGRVVLPVLHERRHAAGSLVETLPLPGLVAAAAGLGHVDVEQDSDGVVRSVYLKAGLGTAYWPAFPLAMLRAAQPDGWQRLPGQRNPDSAPPSPYAWVRDHRILIPSLGAGQRFAQLSYIDVLRGEFPADLIRDRFVLVGVIAEGLASLHITPGVAANHITTGVEFNAQALESVLREGTVRPLALPWQLFWNAVLVFIPVWLYAISPPRWTPLLTLASMAAVMIGTVWVLRMAHVWFVPAAALLVLALSYPLWSWQQLLRAQRALRQEKERMEVTLHSIGDSVIAADTVGNIEYLNPAAEKMTGYTLQEARGRPLQEVLQVKNERDHQLIQLPLDHVLSLKQSVCLAENTLLMSRSGEEFAVRASLAPLGGCEQQPRGVVLAVSDITSTRQMARALEYQASHDALTGLPNRVLLHDRLANAIARADRAHSQVAVLFIDLDRFKHINDGLGHSIGDTLLKAVAERLRKLMRGRDTVSRLGGDEFVIVLDDLDLEDRAATVARKVLEALSAPLTIEQREFWLGASIGISLYPRDGASREELLKNADRAMYHAKEAGGNTFKFYAEALNQRTLKHLTMEPDLRRALERGELEVHYQPQVALRSGTVIGLEALLRWRHPRLGMIPPQEFVPLAEETGLIIPIGEWVLRTVCGQINQWRAAGLGEMRVSINLSPRQFSCGRMTELVADILSQSGLPGRYLGIEITESMIMRDAEEVNATLHELKAMNVDLAIDDFGTGYSSLSYLKRFPIDQLKIDKSFVRDITTDADDAAIAKAVIAMAHSMGRRVIAEGVETRQQLDFLRAQDCDEIQGFFYSHPCPAGEIAEMLRSPHAVLMAE